MRHIRDVFNYLNNYIFQLTRYSFFEIDWPIFQKFEYANSEPSGL